MYSTLLVAHLGGALLTAIVGASAGVALWYNRTASCRSHAVLLGALACFEILTGVALSIASIEITALSLCANVALYLSAVFAIEALLYVRIQQDAMGYPSRLVFSPIALSLVVMAGAIGAGV